MSKLSVIQTGGKQYIVTDGQKVRVDKMDTAAGKKVTFKEVLLTSDSKTTTIGTPLIKGAKVEAKVLAHVRGKKVTGVKMKAKKRHKKLFGHKQHYTEVEITKA
ncbi:MAG: 50S ribosomal protein L21 [bacterium]|nr:50S ribosomal protein L21 [bacterium]